MILKVLGTNSPYCLTGKNGPGYLLITDDNKKIMIDCGSGCHSELTYPNDLNDLSIIISHLHKDHYNDLFNVLYAAHCFKKQNRLDNDVNIFLPNTPETSYSEVVLGEYAEAAFNVINETSSLEIGNATITFLKTDHPCETYAIKVKCDNSTFVYTADTSYSLKDRLVDFAKDADILLSESSLLVSHGHPEICNHLTAHQAATIAKEANVKKLVLTHFWPEESLENYENEAKDVFENVICAKELMEIKF